MESKVESRQQQVYNHRHIANELLLSQGHQPGVIRIMVVVQKQCSEDERLSKPHTEM